MRLGVSATCGYEVVGESTWDVMHKRDACLRAHRCTWALVRALGFLAGWGCFGVCRRSVPGPWALGSRVSGIGPQPGGVVAGIDTP